MGFNKPGIRANVTLMAWVSVLCLSFIAWYLALPGIMLPYRDFAGIYSFQRNVLDL